jgi:hypothetical protein
MVLSEVTRRVSVDPVVGRQRMEEATAGQTLDGYRVDVVGHDGVCGFRGYQ